MTVNTIVNGGFETGDFTGWTIDHSEFNAQTLVDAEYADGSNYGAEISTSVGYGYPDTGDWVSIEQPFTMNNNFISMTFNLKKLAAPQHACKITCRMRVDNDALYDIWTVTQSEGSVDPDPAWGDHTITLQDIIDAGITAVTGVDLIKFIKETQE